MRSSFLITTVLCFCTVSIDARCSAEVAISKDGFLPTQGKVTTVAGAGGKNNNGSKGDYDEINIGQTFGVEVGPDEHLYICEVENHRIWKLNLRTQHVEVVAGTGKKGYGGDGILATKADMNEPYEVRFDKGGNLFVVEMQNHIVRRIDKKTQKISTIAGTGTPGFSGDGGPANEAQLRRPHSIAIHDNQLFIADIGNHRIRKVDLDSGTIGTIVGNGEKKLPTEGYVDEHSSMVGPRALYAIGGSLWIALREGHSVWKLDLESHKLSHVAGSGKKGYSGDGGPLKLATFNGPKGIVVDRHERAYVVDTENQVIRRIDTKAQRIATVVGSGKRGVSSSFGTAKEALMDRPHGICADHHGFIYIGDTNNHRVIVVRDELLK